MGNVFYFDWEVNLIEWLQKTIGSAGQAIAKALSFIGGETIMLLVLLVVLFCYNKEAGKRCGFTIVTASMWFPMIKNIVLRIRPYMAHPERIEALTVVEADADPMDVLQQGYSFPSGHSANAAAMYGSIAREIRKKWMWWLAVIIPLYIIPQTCLQGGWLDWRQSGSAHCWKRKCRKNGFAAQSCLL